MVPLPGRQETLAHRHPWLIAFTFGLLHGLAFAGALAEVGLPRGAEPQALLYFNVGVEIGQLMFIGVALARSGCCGRFASDCRSTARSLLGSHPPM